MSAPTNTIFEGENVWMQKRFNEEFDEERALAEYEQEMAEAEAENLPKQWPQTDSGNAEFFAELFGNDVHYDYKRGRWMLWNKKLQRWVEDKQDAIRVMAKNAMRIRAKQAASISGKTEAEKEFRWSLSSESSVRLNALLREAQALHPITDDGEGWDADPWLFGVANGVLDLRTGNLRQATRTDLMTKFSTVTFDPAAKCPRWLKFLNEIFGGDAKLIEYIQKACGYTLTGNIQEQCLFALYGSGANGKTTFLEAIISILADYGTDLPFSVLEPKHFGTVPGEGVNLPGARLAKCVEVREGRQLDEARIKAWTGGDSITIRPLYSNPFTIYPTHKLWLCFNHRPSINDNSNSMWRRVHLIPFDQTFGPGRVDKNLPNDLQGEASGILNWMLAGCIAWQRDGLVPPDAVIKATAKYAEDSDVLQPFLDDRCIIDPDQEVAKGDLWKAYQMWAAGSKERPLSRKVFGERLGREFLERRAAGTGTRFYKGIGLKKVAPVVHMSVNLADFAQDDSDDEAEV